ncbi:MAG: 50S ribosomal protein L25 [Armatimonadota bacterium]|nr:50S ribosomal protein L25 [Armatimonadota bacterium]
MQRNQLSAAPRSMLGKTRAKRLRRDGWTPAIMYGRGMEPRPLQVRTDAFLKLMKSVGPNVMVEVVVDGDPTPHTTMIKKIQRDCLTLEILNIDFHRISLTDRVTNRVPIELVGEPHGVREGGILLTPVSDIEIRGIVTALPPSIKVDVSGLGIDEAIHVRDLVLPEGIEALAPPDEVIAVVHAPRVAEEKPAGEPEAAPAAPEGESTAS